MTRPLEAVAGHRKSQSSSERVRNGALPGCLSAIQHLVLATERWHQRAEMARVILDSVKNRNAISAPLHLLIGRSSTRSAAQESRSPLVTEHVVDCGSAISAPLPRKPSGPNRPCVQWRGFKHRADFHSRFSLRENTRKRYFRGAKGDNKSGVRVQIGSPLLTSCPGPVS